MTKRKLALTALGQTNLDSFQAASLIRESGIHTDVVPVYNTQNSDELISYLKGYDYTIAASELYSEAVLRNLPDLKLIVRFGVGIDTVDLDVANRYGVAVCNLPGANAGTVAEHALALMLAVLHELPAYNEDTHQGNFRGYAYHELGGVSVGLIGFGAIARRLAELLRAFGMPVFAYDPFVSAETMAEYGVQKQSLTFVQKNANILSLHLPSNTQTFHLIDAEFISGMQDGAYLVNTSRGPIVDEKALAEALKSGKLSGAGIDVYETEPDIRSSPLLSCKTALLTPHMSAGSYECAEHVLKLALQTVIDFHQGKPLRNLLTKPR